MKNYFRLILLVSALVSTILTLLINVAVPINASYGYPTYLPPQVMPTPPPSPEYYFDDLVSCDGIGFNGSVATCVGPAVTCTPAESSARSMAMQCIGQAVSVYPTVHPVCSSTEVLSVECGSYDEKFTWLWGPIYAPFNTCWSGQYQCQAQIHCTAKIRCYLGAASTTTSQ